MRGQPRRAQKRDSNEREIRNALSDAGYLVSEGGPLCDLIACDPLNDNRVTLLEVKGAKGRLTPYQEACIAAGWPIRVVRSVEAAFDAVAR